MKDKGGIMPIWQFLINEFLKCICCILDALWFDTGDEKLLGNNDSPKNYKRDNIDSKCENIWMEYYIW